MQQMTLSLYECDNTVCNCYLLAFIYPTNKPEVKSNVQTVQTQARRRLCHSVTLRASQSAVAHATSPH